MNAELAAELAEMAGRDQRVRTPPPGAGHGVAFRLSTEQAMTSRQVDVHNADRLRDIMDAHGWPGRELVGEQGAQHAWLIVQHADHQLDLQREALALLKRAVADGDASPRHLAYLTDRVRTNEGRPQLYGTQMTGGEGDGPVPWPVEDPARLDERRAGMGLEPFEDYAAGFRGAREG